MEWLIGLSLILIIVLVLVKKKFITFNLKRPILIPIKIKDTNTEEYKKHSNRGC